MSWSQWDKIIAKCTLHTFVHRDNKPRPVQSVSLDVSTKNSVDRPQLVAKADLPVVFPYRFNSSCLILSTVLFVFLVNSNKNYYIDQVEKCRSLKVPIKIIHFYLMWPCDELTTYIYKVFINITFKNVYQMFWWLNGLARSVGFGFESHWASLIFINFHWCAFITARQAHTYEAKYNIYFMVQVDIKLIFGWKLRCYIAHITVKYVIFELRSAGLQPADLLPIVLFLPYYYSYSYYSSHINFQKRL